jgi:hypothetical protein
MASGYLRFQLVAASLGAKKTADRIYGLTNTHNKEQFMGQ